MLPPDKRGRVLAAFSGGLIAVTFILDLLTPLGVAVWVLYLIPLSMVVWWGSRGLPSFTAFVCALLLVLGYLYSPPGGPEWMDLVNRSLGGFAILVIAILADLTSK